MAKIECYGFNHTHGGHFMRPNAWINAKDVSVADLQKRLQNLVDNERRLCRIWIRLDTGNEKCVFWYEKPKLDDLAGILNNLDGDRQDRIDHIEDPRKTTQPVTKTPDVETLIAASLQHGQDSEPDHEAGDLQEYLREGFSLLNADQRRALLHHPRLKSAVKTATGQELRVTEKMLQKTGIEKILDIFQEHGNDEGPEAEISDLQNALRSCWDVLTAEQRIELLELDSVQETFENATMEQLMPSGQRD